MIEILNLRSNCKLITIFDPLVTDLLLLPKTEETATLQADTTNSISSHNKEEIMASCPRTRNMRAIKRR
jgi:hypothetical protein